MLPGTVKAEMEPAEVKSMVCANASVGRNVGAKLGVLGSIVGASEGEKVGGDVVGGDVGETVRVATASSIWNDKRQTAAASRNHHQALLLPRRLSELCIALRIYISSFMRCGPGHGPRR